MLFARARLIRALGNSFLDMGKHSRKEKIMSSPASAKEAFYKSYSEFSKTLRTWFVAYGIGGPIVLLSNNAAWGWLVKSGRISLIGLLFLMGGVLQVIGALLNKHAMWYLYIGEERSEAKNKYSYKISDTYSNQGWIDVVIDIATLILFGWATWLAFSIIMSAPAEIFTNAKS
jgi:hypothetical protein